MKPKFTKEYVEKYFIDKGYHPLFDKYHRTEDKLLALSPDGYKVMTVFSDFKRGSMPYPFHPNNPYTVENIKVWLKNNKRNFILISDEYRGANSKLKWECLLDGYTWEASWSNIRKSVYGCHVCGDLKKYTINEVKEEIGKINPNIEILSEEYISNKAKLKCRCLNKDCHHEWSVAWTDIKRGYGCKKCADRKNPGGYNIMLAERHKKEWLNKVAILYKIKCWNKNESFYKVGITTRSIKSRFSGKFMPYNYMVLESTKTNLYDAVYAEDKLKKNNTEHSYCPLIHFGGHNECFTILNEEKVVR